VLSHKKCVLKHKTSINHYVC